MAPHIYISKQCYKWVSSQHVSKPADQVDFVWSCSKIIGLVKTLLLVRSMPISSARDAHCFIGGYQTPKPQRELKQWSGWNLEQKLDQIVKTATAKNIHSLLIINGIHFEGEIWQTHERVNRPGIRLLPWDNKLKKWRDVSSVGLKTYIGNYFHHLDCPPIFTIYCSYQYKWKKKRLKKMIGHNTRVISCSFENLSICHFCPTVVHFAYEQGHRLPARHSFICDRRMADLWL